MQLFPMAAEWGGIFLATLLGHGLLEKTKTIGCISAEATASAVLQKTLDVSLEVFCLDLAAQDCTPRDKS